MCRFSVKSSSSSQRSGVKSFWTWSAGIALNRDSGMFVEELRDGSRGKGIGRGPPGLPGLKGAEPDRESAPAQQLGGLGLADIVLCAPGFEPAPDWQKLFRHGYVS